VKRASSEGSASLTPPGSLGFGDSQNDLFMAFARNEAMKQSSIYNQLDIPDGQEKNIGFQVTHLRQPGKRRRFFATPPNL